MKAKLILFLGIEILALSFSSCKKSKTISCDWVGQAEYQQTDDSASK